MYKASLPRECYIASMEGKKVVIAHPLSMFELKHVPEKPTATTDKCPLVYYDEFTQDITIEEVE